MRITSHAFNGYFKSEQSVKTLMSAARCGMQVEGGMRPGEVVPPRAILPKQPSKHHSGYQRVTNLLFVTQTQTTFSSLVLGKEDM